MNNYNKKQTLKQKNASCQANLQMIGFALRSNLTFAGRRLFLFSFF
jgi:hypothetical protein